MHQAPGNPRFPEQDADGVDLSILRTNLRLTPTERVRKADAHMRELERLRAQQPEVSRRIFERLKREW